MYEYSARLKRVIDADTLEMTLDLGFKTFLDCTLRLAMVNGPELSTAAGKIAKAAVEQWFKDNPGPYVVNTAKDKQEKYGRYLALVRSAEQRFLIQDMISEGHLVVWTGKGPRPGTE